MILRKAGKILFIPSIPRMSGDDPLYDIETEEPETYSPHERG